MIAMDWLRIALFWIVAIVLLRTLRASLLWILNRRNKGKPRRVPEWDVLLLSIIIAWYLFDLVRHTYFSFSK